MTEPFQSTLPTNSSDSSDGQPSAARPPAVAPPEPTDSSDADRLPTAGPLPLDSFDAARRPAYIGFTHRIPFVLAAYRLGFAPGLSEEYTFQTPGQNCQLPAVFLDNNFRDPYLERWLALFKEYKPKIGVLGDAETRDEARRYVDVATQLANAYPGFEPVVVPKCDCFDLIPEDVIIEFAEGASVADGKSATHPLDFSEYADWRGRRVHVLGGTPPRQYQVIEALTQTTHFTDTPPADIIGLDYNGFYPSGHGAYWTRDGWIQPPRDELGTKFCREYWVDQGYISGDPGTDAHAYSMLEKVTIGLHEAKGFWQERNLWPSVTPREVYSPAVLAPDDGQLADGTPVQYSSHELHAGFVRVVDDKPGMAGSDRVRVTLAKEDSRSGGTLKPTDRVPEPVSFVEDSDGTVRCRRSPVAADSEQLDDDRRVVSYDIALTDARLGLTALPDNPPNITIPQ